MSSVRVSLKYFFVSGLFISLSVFGAPITIGDVIRVKHVASGKFLCSGEKSFKNGKFDGIEELDRRHKQVWLTDESGFDCLWAVKAEHSDDLRWNSSLGSPLKGEQKFRLENLGSHCNFSILRDARHVVAMKRISRPMGVGAATDQLKIELVNESGEPSSAVGSSEIEDESFLKLCFTDVVDKDPVLFVNQDGELEVKQDEDLAEKERKAGVWDFDLVETGFAKKENDSLKASMESMRQRSEIAEVQGTLVSTVCLWQDESATNFLIIPTNNYDFYSYISKHDNTRAITSKLQERLSWVDIVDYKSFWSTDRFRQVRKAVLKNGIVKDWIEVDGQAEFVFAGRNDEAYRLSSVGWGLYKTASVEPDITWEDEPIIDGVVSADVGADGTLWWVDLDGNVHKKLNEKVEPVFEHQAGNYPKFIKLSAAGTFEKNYVALLRSDGQLFLSKNNGAFFNPGLSQILDVSVGRAGRVAMIMRRLNWVHGPIFKADFKEFERWNLENDQSFEVDFETPEEFVDHFSYNFELVKKSQKWLSELISDFEASADNVFNQLKKYEPAKEFFNQRLVPASQEIKVGRVARQAIKRLGKEIFGVEQKPDSNNVDSEKLSTLNDENSKLKGRVDELKKEGQSIEQERVSLENKVELMSQELEASLTKIDELEAENKDLKVKVNDLEKVQGSTEQKKEEPDQVEEKTQEEDSGK